MSEACLKYFPNTKPPSSYLRNLRYTTEILTEILAEIFTEVGRYISLISLIPPRSERISAGSCLLPRASCIALRSSLFQFASLGTGSPRPDTATAYEIVSDADFSGVITSSISSSSRLFLRWNFEARFFGATSSHFDGTPGLTSPRMNASSADPIRCDAHTSPGPSTTQAGTACKNAPTLVPQCLYRKAKFEQCGGSRIRFYEYES